MKNLRKNISILFSVVMTLLLFAEVSISASAENEDKLKYGVIGNKTVEITDCDASTSGHVDIPAKIDGYTVTMIGIRAFSRCRDITSITIPDSITFILDDAFNGSTALERITVDENNKDYSSDEFGVLYNKLKTNLVRCPEGFTDSSYVIPDTVKLLGINCFDNCSSLKNITIPQSVTGICISAFSGSGILSIDIPDSVTCISGRAFAGCRNLTNVTLGNGIKDILFEAFNGCEKLTKIHLPESLQTIGDQCFANCKKLSGIIRIPANVQKIGNTAFPSERITAFSVDNNNQYYCNDKNGILFDKEKTTIIRCPSNFRGEYTIPDSVTEIADEAFYECTELTNITLPSKLTVIGSFAFFYASALKEINFPKTVTTIGKYAFGSCSNLTNLYLPDSITDIGECAFNGCSNLTTVRLSDNINTIPREAFQYCNKLESVTIPSKITSIGKEAFFSCRQLKYVYYTGSEEEWNNLIIDSDNEKLTSAYIHYNTEDCLYSRDNADTIFTDTASAKKTGYTEYACTCCDKMTREDFAFEVINGILIINDAADLAAENVRGWNAWSANEDPIKTLMINGIDAIGQHTFCNLSDLTIVIIDTENIAIAPNAFADCPALSSVVFFGSCDFGNNAFVDCADTVRIYVDSEKSYPDVWNNDTLRLIPYVYDGATLSFEVPVTMNAYEFFDTVTAFCLRFDNIELLKFTHLTLPDLPMYYVPEGGASLKQVENGILEDAEIYPLVRNAAVTYNVLVSGINDGSITDFSLATEEKNHADIIDTEIKIADVIRDYIARALRWVVTLMNKVFALFSKLFNKNG